MIAIQNFYLFVASFEDGTQIFQDETDISRINPEKSQFFDVLEKEKESKLISFVLLGQGAPFGVDLRDGHFEVAEVPFFLHRNDRQQLSEFRIIYFRNLKHEINPVSGEMVSFLGYTIGWQTTFEGKNIQKFIKTLDYRV